jgi:hypothetical protein
MERREVDVAQPAWLEQMQRLDPILRPLFRRIRAAHDEGDYETRDRLLHEVEKLRPPLELR